MSTILTQVVNGSQRQSAVIALQRIVSGLTSAATKFESAGIGQLEIVRGLTSAATRLMVDFSWKALGNSSDVVFCRFLSCLVIPFGRAPGDA